ncbi:uncharacterized protein BDCG_04552 [Blastomyces dermatitidis ER-3]|uniref:Uncharacterized protein n=1 Tax=Ajellomyces dermatitidis (strain ER-3 / ATCC MYA-2586) TaxID=559297 RepID=A0ABP2EYV2_AJEDR|nr:uncharacterized protein BDCG_04552 [Blastomyces dermatitidis ER-3]EEQ89432.1 hypothetical protein BDCG_04552 [Blastomyces dermatitidis ER-3]
MSVPNHSLPDIRLPGAVAAINPINYTIQLNKPPAAEAQRVCDTKGQDEYLSQTNDISFPDGVLIRHQPLHIYTGTNPSENSRVRAVGVVVKDGYTDCNDAVTS